MREGELDFPRDKLPTYLSFMMWTMLKSTHIIYIKLALGNMNNTIIYLFANTHLNT